ncbi:hypothetical protein MADA3029_940106 [Vibrio nigripulchritudo MADA3029]|uniref:Flp family type IVb pilin n=1 Tax=Vibrio nigripulchritudo TaxID=28173 RepID=UPI0003B1D3C6|nr:Flp family type IVb pilin [Vibrio nigripulchritudo]CCN50440.1 hypothetical protein VIBNIMADA3020_910104 [Vibrio nigripulchritudo MADA3020]CCN52391.1 hypothetical protein VIBNIMADA3021_1230104 [Vibrio nigripulchritudo MADA3021]CCN62218.1 hypothetical protein MADA3029_940106 [Vibrio nigripulchritudo MADA3029]
MLYELYRKLIVLWLDVRGVTTIEYGVLAAGLALVVSVILGEDGAFTEALESAFGKVTESIDGNSSGGAEGN